MREIEIRVKLNDSEENMLRAWLDTNAKKTGEKKHLEHYLDNSNKSFMFDSKLGYRDAENYLRVRYSEKGDSVCLKNFEINRETGKSKNIDEIEFNVSSGDEALKMLKSLGFIISGTIDKSRESFNYENFDIEIDDVKGLGKFAEFEIKGVEESADISVGFDQIKLLLKKIGFKSYLESNRGYLSMLWNPDYDFNKLKTLE